MSWSHAPYLFDILKAMDAAESFVADMTFEELEDDQRTQYALQRAFEIIGEAAKQIDDATCERYPDVPWLKMAGMRDLLIHKHFAVNLKVV